MKINSGEEGQHKLCGKQQWRRLHDVTNVMRYYLPGLSLDVARSRGTLKRLASHLISDVPPRAEDLR